MNNIPPIAQSIIQAWPEQPSEAAKQQLIDWLKTGLANQQRRIPTLGICFEKSKIRRGISATFYQGRERWTIGITRRRPGENQGDNYWRVFVIKPKTHTPDPEMVEFTTASARRLAGVE